jgi:hypothetical protein
MIGRLVRHVVHQAASTTADAVVPYGDGEACLRPPGAQAVYRFLKILGLSVQGHRVGGHGGHDDEVVGVVHLLGTFLVVPVGQIDHLLVGPALLHGLAYALDEPRNDQRVAVDPRATALSKRFPASGTVTLHRRIGRGKRSRGWK